MAEIAGPALSEVSWLLSRILMCHVNVPALTRKRSLIHTGVRSDPYLRTARMRFFANNEEGLG